MGSPVMPNAFSCDGAAELTFASVAVGFLPVCFCLPRAKSDSLGPQTL